MSYRAVDPTFEAFQWDGTNRPAVEAFVSSYHNHPVTYSFVAGSPDNPPMIFCRDGMYFNLFIPEGYWVFRGPHWGTDHSQADFFTRAPEQFAAQYEAV